MLLLRAHNSSDPNAGAMFAARSNDLTHILGELRPDYLRDVLHTAIQFGCHNTTTINAALQQWCKSLDDTHVIRRTLVSLFHTGLDWPARLDAALHSQPTATAVSSDQASAAGASSNHVSSSPSTATSANDASEQAPAANNGPSFCGTCDRRNDANATMTSTHMNTGGVEGMCTCVGGGATARDGHATGGNASGQNGTTSAGAADDADNDTIASSEQSLPTAAGVDCGYGSHFSVFHQHVHSDNVHTDAFFDTLKQVGCLSSVACGS